MAVRLTVMMRDDGDWCGTPTAIEIDPIVEARLIQEEVWDQIGWPPGEVPLAERIARFNGSDGGPRC